MPRFCQDCGTMICSDHCSCGWAQKTSAKAPVVKKYTCHLAGCGKDGFLSTGNGRHICADHYYAAQRVAGKQRRTDEMVDRNIKQQSATEGDLA